MRYTNENGITVLELIIGMAITLVLTVVAGLGISNNAVSNNQQKAVEVTAKAAYSASLANLADFDDRTTVESAIDEVLGGLDSDEIEITFEGHNKFNLCITATWVGSDNAASVGVCE